jgi:hypothetical protein
MLNIQKFFVFTVLIAALSACQKEEEKVIPVTPPPPGTVEISPEVGGPEQPNMAFINLTANTQAALPRNSWDIGLSNGPEFRVILNFASGVLVRRFNINVIDSVKRADWATDSLQVRLNLTTILNRGIAPSANPWLPATAAWIDNPNGRLDSTAIREIALADASNDVYLMQRGTNPDGSARGMILIQIFREGNGYKVILADTGEIATNKRSYTYTKQGNTGFGCMNLTNGQTSPFFPTTWHLNFTNFISLFPLTGPGSQPIPYRFSDFVLINTVDVQGYMTDTVAVKYADFRFSNIDLTRLTNNRSFIGSSWRNVGGPGAGSTPSLRLDRYYILRVNDPTASSGARFYKLRFTRLVNELAQRGFPRFELLELRP